MEPHLRRAHRQKVQKHPSEADRLLALIPLVALLLWALLLWVVPLLSVRPIQPAGARLGALRPAVGHHGPAPRPEDHLWSLVQNRHGSTSETADDQTGFGKNSPACDPMR